MSTMHIVSKVNNRLWRDTKCGRSCLIETTTTMTTATTSIINSNMRGFYTNCMGAFAFVKVGVENLS
jgi:hypothetical protein